MVCSGSSKRGAKDAVSSSQRALLKRVSLSPTISHWTACALMMVCMHSLAMSCALNDVGSKMHHLTKPVYKHHYLGVARLSHGKLGDQINTDALSPSARDLQRLQQTTWFLIAVCFVFLTFRAASDMLTHVFTHAFLPVQLFHGLLRLGNTKMTTVWAVVQLVQALLSQFLTVWDDQGIAIPPEALPFTALGLVCRGQPVKPICILLIPFLHLHLTACSRLLLSCQVKVLRQNCAGV